MHREAFVQTYCPYGEDGDSEASFAFWQSNVHCIPGAARDAEAAFQVQLQHPELMSQWLGRQQLAQVVFWGEVLSQQQSWEAVGATWQRMHAALSHAAEEGKLALALSPTQVLEVHEGLLRALVLATPPSAEAIQAVQGLVRAVMDGGLAEGIAAASAHEGEQGGLHESWGESLAMARASSVLALPHWVLHESADDFAAVQSTQGADATAAAAADDSSGVIGAASLDQGAAQRVQLYWGAFVWPNPAMETAEAVWEDSARSEIAPWWAQSTYSVQMWHALHSSLEEPQLPSEKEEGGGDFVALCAAKAQFAEDHVEALVLGWCASGRAEYLSTLLEIASGWLQFAPEFGWAPLVHDTGESEETAADMDSQLGVAIPHSMLDTPAAAARWAGSRLAGQRLLELAQSDPGAWAGMLRHFEAMRSIAMEAFDAEEAAGLEEEGGPKGYFEALGDEGALPEGPMPTVPGLPPFAMRVLNAHAVLLPSMRKLRESARQDACAALLEEGQHGVSSAQRRLWQLQAAEPGKAATQQGQVVGSPRDSGGQKEQRAGASRFPSAR